MKYYHEVYVYNGRERDIGYRIQNLPQNTPVWGFAYSIDDDTDRRRLSCLPILGEICENLNGRYLARYVFCPYKKGTTEKRASGSVDFESRMYADTYEEAVEMYNELVDKRIEKLHSMIQEAAEEKIQRGGCL